jgi:hypothetical protein
VSEQYDPVQLVQDATKFARSRFGRHYMKRLDDRSASFLANTTDMRLTNEERANYGLRAAEIAAEIDYFRTAQATVANPSLLERLRQGFKKRKEAEKEDV